MDHYGQLEAFKEFILFCKQQNLPRAKMGDFEAVMPATVPEHEQPKKPTRAEAEAAELELQYAATGVIPVNLKELRNGPRRG